MEANSEDRQKKIYCLGEDLAQTSKKSSETVAETRCDARRKIAEVEDIVYTKADKEKDTRHAIHRQSAVIISEDKQKVVKVRQLASKNMSESMAEMEENTSELRQVTRHKMAGMEQKAAEMVHKTRRKNTA